MKDSTKALEDRLLYEVARLYYEQHRTQLEIARAVKTSRSTVSRLLQRAIDHKIVEIRVSYPWPRNADLENQLIARFGLRHARVLDAESRFEERTIAGIGALGAQLVGDLVRDKDVIGVSYGRAVAAVASALLPKDRSMITVVPIIGTLGPGNTAIDGPELVRQFANAFGGEYFILPAPLLIREQRAHDVLLKLPQVKGALDVAKKAQVVVMGIGDVSHASPIWNGYLGPRSLEWAISRGAVGHMCGQFYDSDGNPLLVSVNQRVVGIGIKALTSIRDVVAVAAGQDKAVAIRAALRGKLLNALITDKAAAQAILR